MSNDQTKNQAATGMSIASDPQFCDLLTSFGHNWTNGDERQSAVRATPPSPSAAMTEQDQAKPLPARRFVNVAGFWDADYVEFAEGQEKGGGVLNGVPHHRHYTRREAESYVAEGAWREVAVPLGVEQSAPAGAARQGGNTSNSTSVAAPIAEGERDLRMLSHELSGVIADVENGQGFDDVCLDTIKRVRAALASRPAAEAWDCRKLGGNCACPFGGCKNGLDEPAQAYAVAKPVEAGELPPLPEPDVNDLEPVGPPTAFSDKKMHAYGQECVRAALATNAAAREGWKSVPIEPTEDMVVAGFESRPDPFFSKPEDWDTYERMTGCQQAAHRARLCWAAMLAAVPEVQP